MSVYAQEYGYFFNSSSSDRTYNAESFEKWLKPFFVSGVFTGGLEVVAQDTPDMTVNITAGYANLDGKLGFFPNDSTVTLSVASGVYDRIDTIVLRRDNVNRTISIEVVTGTASVDPLPTPPTRDEDTFELVLAQILVGTGVTEIGQGDITDTRLDPDLCGYVCAAVQTPDFMDLYDQFTAQFQTWFDHMKDQLDEDAAGHLQLEIDDINDAMGVVPAGETLQGEIEQVDEDLGIVVNGNKTAHAGGAAIGQYIILRNSTITGCANGVYTAAKAIPFDTVIDSTYLTPVPDGGLNALNASLTYGGKVTVTLVDSGGEAGVGSFSDSNAKAGDVIIAVPQPDSGTVRVFLKCVCGTDGTITVLASTYNSTAFTGQRPISYIGIHQ